MTDGEAGDEGGRAGRVGGITPAPTDEEAAAIVAAIEGAWPRAVVDGGPPPVQRWRWSGRWWSKPVPLSRRRPW